jgi:hypothetical protein
MRCRPVTGRVKKRATSRQPRSLPSTDASTATISGSEAGAGASRPGYTPSSTAPMRPTSGVCASSMVTAAVVPGPG